MLPVVEIELNGQKFPVRYDINALGELEHLTGQNTLDGSMKFDIRALHALAYVGLKCGHKFQHRDTSKFDKSLEQLGEWMSISDLKLFPPILVQFTSGDQDKRSSKESNSADGMGE